MGPYRIVERLGSGGFGTVFRAERGREPSALKFLALQDVGEWAEREVVVLARVRHPNVVRLRGFWQWPEAAPRYHVVVMDYVPGRRLDVWTRAENPSARQVLRLVLGVARGLSEAHRAKVVHRDVKEANIIVREPDGEAVLVDFGVSGCEEAARVTGGMMGPGTLEYRSPWAWRFRLENKHNPRARYQATPADDVYALGVVFYWLLTDVLPFSASDGPGLEALLTRPPMAPHVRNPRVPPEVGALCLRLMEKQPGLQPGAEEVCQAVEELLAREGMSLDTPLCEEHGGQNVTTEPGEEVDEESLWLNRLRQREARPRRGKRLPERVEECAPVPAAEATPRPAVVSVPRLRFPTLGRGGRMAAGLALGLVVGVLAARTLAPGGTGFEAPLPTWEDGWKVAPPLKAPDSAHGLFAAGEAVSTPVAFAATLKEGDASVKTQQQKRLGAVKKTLATVGACTVLGCPGAQVRPPPEPKPCPPGAVETMEKFGIRIGHTGAATFFLVPGMGSAQPTTVSEGWTSLRMWRPWKKMKEGTLSGELIFGERVYGRLTQIRTVDGTFPVCIELHEDEDGVRGLIRMPNGSATTAKVFSTVRLVAVPHFK
ncbi:MAG TPA: serine/threonine-protein kinase [Myxococcaceae bacterium]